MQRYFAKEKNNKNFILMDSDIHHIKNVMRMKNGDLIEVVYNSKLYLCVINIIDNELKIVIKKELQHDKEKIPKVTLIVPLLKEQKMDLILQKATELGVNEIIPIVTERSIIKLDKSKEIKKLQRWKMICKEASEQAHRISIPNIVSIQNLSNLGNIDGVKLVCSTIEKKKNLKKIMKTFPNYDRINVVIGPEGGFSLNEELKLNEMGFESISLGNRIMRVETVPMFVLSIINYEFME